VARRHRVFGILVIGLGLVAAGCILPPKTPPDPPTTTTTTKPYLGTLLPPGAPNPYGAAGKGEFVATCPFSHRATQDPIVAPGNNMFWHEHDFFGNVHTDSSSTPDELRGQDTTCISAFDATGYWIPTLMQNGVAKDADVQADFFYRVLSPQDPSKVQPFPAGLIMVAGSSGATTEQPSYIEQWSCAGTAVKSAVIPTCASGHNLHLTLHFPECWDGVHLDSADHKSHMAYAQGKSCPADHPVLVPQLTFELEWSVTGSGVTVSSDHTMSGTDVTPGLTAHGDFMDGWIQETLQQRVTHCLNAAVICDKNGVVTGS
jgi:hypothetical protein